MATTITAGNATNGAAVASDNTGILELKTGTGSGTTALTLGTGQQVGYTAGTAAAPSITFTGDTNTGIYSPGADRIGFAEGGVQSAELDASGNFKFNSGFGSVATAYGCRAWVNFDGTGTYSPNPSTSKIRASGNVTSITKNLTGDYTVNLTTAMPDANYLVACAARNTAAGANINPLSDSSSASAIRVVTFNTAWASSDPQYVYVALFR